MDLNQNKLFIWGALLLFFGLQCHYFQSFVLTEKASKFYYSRFEKKAKVEKPISPFLKEAPQIQQRKSFQPPDWLGRCLMSVGGVLIFQSIMVRRKE